MKEELIKKLKAEMEKFKEKIRESGVDYAIEHKIKIDLAIGDFDSTKYDINSFIYAGGVSCSTFMRNYLSEHMYKDVNIVFGKPEMSADNAIGTALLGGKNIWL